LNVLGKRPDGFHELETVMLPVALCDRLQFQTASQGIELTCNQAALPTGPENLVYRAAEAFLKTARIPAGVKIHLEKNIPLAAGLGGGSGNAAITLRGLNDLFGRPLSDLHGLAAALGSDVPFFLQSQPALATGRGENIQPLEAFPALRGAHLILIHPGFGVPTAWAYQALASFPAALNGQPGRAEKLVKLLRKTDLLEAGRHFYNSLEAPVLRKYPLLQLFQDFLRAQGAAAALMSGSGSTTFALTASRAAADALLEKFKRQYGEQPWTAMVAL
jgi:4-diphosphocytidyl-2-C-methyl-D-erythritol kinase